MKPQHPLNLLNHWRGPHGLFLLFGRRVSIPQLLPPQVIPHMGVVVRGRNPAESGVQLGNGGVHVCFVKDIRALTTFSMIKADIVPSYQLV